MPNVCVRDLTPDDYVPGSPTTVTLTCTIDTGATSTYIVEDTYPVGWTISNLSTGGVDNGTSVRWFFLDNADRVLSYDATPPALESGVKNFSGTIDSDGSGGFQSVPTTGESSSNVPSSSLNTCVSDFTPDDYTPGSPITVTLTTTIDTGSSSTYIVEDTYPTGWTISNLSTGGVDNGTSVRWFFLDNADRVLSYDATPPALETGLKSFSGTIDSDGPGGFQSGTIAGERDADLATTTTTVPPGAGAQVCRTFSAATYTPGVAFGVELAANIPAGDHATYIVEEFTPFGWIPDTISDGGVFNGTSIRWLFLDSTNRNLTYNITSPLDETATRSFAGHGLFDGGTVGFRAVSITCDTSISQGAAPPVRDLTPIVSSVVCGAGENMSAEIEHYGDGALRPTAGPDEIGAFPCVWDGAALLVSEDIDAGDLINIWNDGGVAKARKADQSDSRPSHGWADDFGSVGDAVRVRTFGSTNSRLAGLSPGSEYWLAEDGGLDTNSGASPIAQKVGIALSVSELLFLPETV